MMNVKGNVKYANLEVTVLKSPIEDVVTVIAEA